MHLILPQDTPVFRAGRMIHAKKGEKVEVESSTSDYILFRTAAGYYGTVERGRENEQKYDGDSW